MCFHSYGQFMFAREKVQEFFKRGFSCRIFASTLQLQVSLSESPVSVITCERLQCLDAKQTCCPTWQCLQLPAFSWCSSNLFQSLSEELDQLCNHSPMFWFRAGCAELPLHVFCLLFLPDSTRFEMLEAHLIPLVPIYGPRGMLWSSLVHLLLICCLGPHTLASVSHCCAAVPWKGFLGPCPAGPGAMSSSVNQCKSIKLVLRRSALSAQADSEAVALIFMRKVLNEPTCPAGLQPSRAELKNLLPWFEVARSSPCCLTSLEML